MTTDQSPPVGSGGPDRITPELGWLCGILMVGAFAALLDGSIVNVAIDTLTSSFHSTLPTIQWVITGYLLALCVSIPVSGWAMEQFGPKRVWIAAQAIFLLGSVLSGASWSAPVLIVFRVLQGIGGGLMMPVGQALLAQSAPRTQLTRLMGLVSVPVMVAPVVGPALGGVIIDDLGWRWIFYLNVPLCLAVIALSMQRIADPVERTPRRLDVIGLGLLTSGLVMLLYGLSEAGSAGGFGGAASVTGIVVGAVLLTASTLHALSGPSSSRLLDLRLLSRRVFTAGTAASFVLSAAMYGALIMMPLYFQSLRGDSAMTAGLFLVPQGVGYVLAVGIVGKVAERIGVRSATLIGVVLAIAGTIPFALADEHTSETLLGVALLVRGFGFGSSMLPSTTAPYRVVQPTEMPGATSLFNIFQRVGASLGTAILAVILQQQVTAGLAHRKGFVAAEVPAYHLTFWWVVALTIVAIAPCLLLPGRALRAVVAPPQRTVPADQPAQAD